MNKMEFYVEQPKSSSLEMTSAVNKLLRQLNETADLLTEADIKDILTSPKNCFFIARRLDNKEVIGMLTMIMFRIPFAKKGVLEDIVVDRRYRGKGIGTKLIETAINKARKEGVVFLDFTSRPTRVEANKLYQRLGFKKRDTNIYRIIL